MSQKDSLKSQKKYIVNEIKKSAQIYKTLLDKTFLIVYENCWVEVTFFKQNFKHLTGVSSTIKSAEEFYNKSVDKTITSQQISFTAKHPYRTCKKKLSYLQSIDNLFYNDVFVVENLHTQSLFIKIGVSELNYTVGFIENTDENGIKINDILVPATLRINDDGFTLSEKQYEADLIFVRANSDKTYKE